MVMNKSDYDKGVLKIISDSSKFKAPKELRSHPTARGLASAVHEEVESEIKGHLDSDMDCKIYPSGSQPARIYGLPKMHKPRGPNLMPPFISIVSSIGIYNYDLAEHLCILYNYISTLSFVLMSKTFKECLYQVIS